MDLSDSTALVTGAASGLGAATASALAARGVTVLGLDLPAQLEKATAPDGVTLAAADVTDEAQVVAALATIASPLRVVVNCAGIAPAIRLLASKGVHDLASFERTLDVNTVGTFNVMRLAAEVMATNEPVDADGQRGLIVNTASVAAFDGQIGQVAYSASKGAIVGMTLPAARDLARHGIRVCTIAPGIVATPLLTALGDKVVDSLSATVPFPARLARPDEFAKLVLMLAEHDYLNGETIRMDGALRMAPQ
jgi:NAD(P)-dependent dehydrogenase (short-subunit alcohol dehydrogenase family)